MSTDSFGGAGMVGEDFISEITTFKKKIRACILLSISCCFVVQESQHINELAFQSLPVIARPLKASQPRRRTWFSIPHVWSISYVPGTLGTRGCRELLSVWRQRQTSSRRKLLVYPENSRQY